MINICKGTKDILPKDSYKWQIVRKVAEDLAKKYNLKEISTPVFESTDLFVRSDGDSSDIVNKEMYTFLDKGDRSITLKPEGTAGVVRSYIENGLGNDLLPVKLYYITPCYRYEKPQAGRLREHHQFGCEIFGANSLASDIEAMCIALDFYRAFGIDPMIKLNFLGCDECKVKYKNILKEFVQPHLPEMCDDCHKRYETNPLRLLDCKSPICQNILKDAPKISDNLCEKCANKFNEIKKMLTSLNVKVELDSKLVRGLDYYTDLVFEFWDSDTSVCKNALGGGGRYDKLVESLGGKTTPVIGFGIGIERLLGYLENKNIQMFDDSVVDIYVSNNTENENYVIKFVNSLRRKGFNVDSDLMGRSLKSQFKYADKIGARFVIVIGDDEINENKISIKNMETGEQIKLWSNDVVEYLNKNV